MHPPRALRKAKGRRAGACDSLVENILLFALGFGLTLVTLVDVFSTILVPGRSAAGLRTAARITRLLLPLARRAARRQRGPGERPANSFAPTLALLSAVAWMVLLLFGFGLMFRALGTSFTPALPGLAEAMYIAGCSLLTLGVSEVDAHGFARWVLLAAGLSGFGVITATISFIMQVQSGLHVREPRVLTLAGMAGRPASGITLLEEYATLGLRDELPRLMLGWRDWSADVLHSHVSYPILAFFHSADAESDWLAALETVLDAATLLMAFTDDPAIGAATLMHRSGARTAARLCEAFALEAGDPLGHDEGELLSLAERLEAAGYRPCDGIPDAARFLALRDDYAPRIRVLAEHLGADRTHLVPGR